MIYAVYDSPLGPIWLTSEHGFLTGVYLSCPHLIDAIENTADPVIRKGFQWLDAYFAGKQPSPLLLPLRATGSPFQQRIWHMLLRIPYGETITYGQLAKLCCKNMSAQAVGQAVGKNPISIMIPCHRVLGHGNRLTGYAGGIDKKVWLLKHEGHDESQFIHPKKYRGK